LSVIETACLWDLKWRLLWITENYPAMPTCRQERKISHFLGATGVSLARLVPAARVRGRFGWITLFRHPELGKVLLLNGEIQHVEAWAPLYHEPLVHLPASFIAEVNDVLILGGGTLYAAAEALKYQTVKRVVVVDREPRVTETIMKYCPHAKACLNDRRFLLLQEDAYHCLSRFRKQFDLVINDGANLLTVKSCRRGQREGSDPFAIMARAVKPQGVCADVIHRHVFEGRAIKATLGHLRRLRCRLALSLVLLPEYHGVLHVLSMWGRTTSLVTQNPNGPVNREQSRWIRGTEPSPCVYYHPRFLPYYLYLPHYLKQTLAIKRRDS
jgi:spermidine synthase